MPEVPAEERQLVLVDGAGSERPLDDRSRTFQFRNVEMGVVFPRFAPGGTRVAVHVDGDIWVYEDGPLRRLTFDGDNTFPSWSPDGTRIAFSSDRGEGRRLFSVPVDGSDTPDLLLEEETDVWESAISPDGNWVAISRGYQNSPNQVDVVAVRLDSPDPVRVPIAETSFNERSLALSTDGRWIAYVSNESGRDEVYVRAFPDPAARTQVSIDGANSPMWAPNGEALYYRTRSGMMMAELETDPGFRVVGRDVLFDDARYARSTYYATYDVDPRSGELLMAATGSDRPRQIIVVLNWFEELRERMGGN